MKNEEEEEMKSIYSSIKLVKVSEPSIHPSVRPFVQAFDVRLATIKATTAHKGDETRRDQENEMMTKAHSVYDSIVAIGEDLQLPGPTWSLAAWPGHRFPRIK